MSFRCSACHCPQSVGKKPVCRPATIRMLVAKKNSDFEYLKLGHETVRVHQLCARCDARTELQKIEIVVVRLEAPRRGMYGYTKMFPSGGRARFRTHNPGIQSEKLSAYHRRESSEKVGQRRAFGRQGRLKFFR